MSDPNPALAIDHLTAGYTTRPIVSAVDLRARSGEVVAIIGANGSGKSTLLRAVSGLVSLHGGSVRLQGVDISRFPAWRRHRMGLWHLPQRSSVFQEMRVEENLRLASENAASSRLGRPDLAHEISTVLPEIVELWGRRVNTLSGGERQLVALARALVARPRVLLVDEPTQGLAEALVARVLAVIRELANHHGVAVLLVEHRVQKALDIADRALVLKSGTVAWQGAARDLASNKRSLAGAFGFAAWRAELGKE